MRASRSTSPLAGRLLSCREAAKILDISDDSVRRLIRTGKLDGVRLGERILRVFGESLEHLMQSNTQTYRLVVSGEAACSVQTDSHQPAAPSNRSSGGNSVSEGGAT